jgi:hypothetical protein
MSRALELVRPYCLLLVIAGVGCGSGSSGAPAAPSPAPPAASPAPGSTGPLNMAGNWIGTLQVPGLPARAVTMLIVQSVDCVDGAWQTDTSEYTGAISGFASQTAFAGSLSLQRPADGQGRCTGVGDTEATVNGSTLTFSVPALTADCVAGGLPQSLTITLRRQ